MKQTDALEILKSGCNVFLTGEPGAGKTHTIGLFTEWLNKEKREYAITASTGIAASHIDGSTIHSWSGLGIRRGLDKQSLEGVKRNMWVGARVKAAKTLVIDEISMLDAVTLDDVDGILKAVHGNTKPFGGIQVVFVGDFFQLPPVGRRPEDQHFAFEARSWKEASPRVCYLTEQHRQSDQTFLDILGAMRAGTTNDQHKEILAACVRPGKIETKLFTHNVAVDNLNAAELAKLPGKPVEYKMESGGNPTLVEMLKKGCLSPDTLVLKKGARVMFTRNNFPAGYVNGSLGVVTEASEHGIAVKLDAGGTVRPDQAEWTWTERREIKAYLRQYPLRLAWAITVHKSQGMSLDSAEVDLTNVFEFGQGYVAISRVRTLEGLHLKGLNDKVFLMHPLVVAQDKIFREQGV